MLAGSRLRRDELGVVFGAHAGKVIVDGQPRYLAFDAKMVTGRPIFRMIQATDSREHAVTSLEIAITHLRAAIRTEAAFEPGRGFIELRLALRKPKCVAPKRGIRIELGCR